MKDLMPSVEARALAGKEKAKFAIGDTVDVKVRIQEGDKTRIQNFTGTVIAMQHGGLRESFTVRRLVDGEGVERTFPLHSPHIAGVDVKRHGEVRRAKLYFLRDRVGKATRLKERRVAIPTNEVAQAEEQAGAKKKKRGAKAKAERKARAAAEGAPKKAKKKKPAEAKR